MPDGARRPYMVGNWKMFKTIAETRSFLEELVPRMAEHGERADIGICPPYTSLAAAIEVTQGSPLRVHAQNMHAEADGAHTGEVSAPMLLELGVHGVVLGHSERRADDNETDHALAAKVPAALEVGLEPILCVGESEAERDGGDTEARLRRQVEEGLANVPEERLAEVVVAYEPVWAIGTGRTATPDQAQETIGFVRALLRERSSDAAERVRILYGGSVKPGNVAEILAGPDVDGALVGGASLKANDFAELVAAAAR